MTVLQAAIISLVAYCTWLGGCWFGGQSIGYEGFGRPLVAGFIVGIVLGDVANGIIIGATINALYLGAVAPGGALSSDLNYAGYVGTALALSAGVSAEMAITIAVPMGLIGTLCWQLFATINSFLAHKADDYAAKADMRGLTWMALGLPQIIGFVIRFVPCFLLLYFGSSVAEDIVSYIPQWLQDMFTVIGGILPAVGMAVLIKLLLPDLRYLGYFIIGYVCVAVLGLSTVSVTLLAISIAAIEMIIEERRDEPVAEDEVGAGDGADAPADADDAVAAGVSVEDAEAAALEAASTGESLEME